MTARLTDDKLRILRKHLEHEYPCVSFREEAIAVLDELLASRPRIVELEAAIRSLLLNDGGDGSNCYNAFSYCDAREKLMSMVGMCQTCGHQEPCHIACGPYQGPPGWGSHTTKHCVCGRRGKPCDQFAIEAMGIGGEG